MINMAESKESEYFTCCLSCWPLQGQLLRQCPVISADKKPHRSLGSSGCLSAISPLTSQGLESPSSPLAHRCEERYLHCTPSWQQNCRILEWTPKTLLVKLGLAFYMWLQVLNHLPVTGIVAEPYICLGTHGRVQHAFQCFLDPFKPAFSLSFWWMAVS